MACARDDADAFDLQQLPTPAAILKDRQGEELACYCKNATVRLSIRSGTLLEGPVRLSYHITGLHELDHRSLALRQFDALMRLGRVPKTLVTTRPPTARRLHLIRTLNALAQTTTPRCIAAELFGNNLVTRDWNHESDYLRMRTRRLIERASDLISGGYLTLFRQRRSRAAPPETANG